ncbi:MAG: hypothetical protein ACK5JE_09575 [Castellaniella sp.]|uniref:hypothetical protein n=1 Tax=Castellaniella sp. TaxID=1955812 RepID=UPI003A888789
MEFNQSEQVYLIGIDDTDNLYTPGTGRHARQLGARLMREGAVRLLDITRHQLLFDPRVRYTSHNSSLCMRVVIATCQPEAAASICRDYLLTHSAPDSDAGLCIAAWHAVPPAIQRYGRRAKQELLDIDQARATAQQHTIQLEGLTGDHGGIIGALAAVGLRRTGMDGRIAWLPNLRETTGVVTAGHLRQSAGIDLIREYQGNATVAEDDLIDAGRWPRPILQEDQAVLLIEKGGPDHGVQWKPVSKQVLRQF